MGARDDKSTPQSREKDPLQLHAAIFGEPPEPEEGYGLGPAWMWILIFLALVVGGFYFGRHYGAFGTLAHIGYLPIGQNAGTHTGAAGPPLSGATVFTSHCASCHQANGQGLPGAFPPLAGSPYVLGDPKRTVSIVLDGLHGPITVNGKTFNGQMPTWKGQLSDAEIAAVLTYVRSTWGNKAPAVTPELVKEMRAKFGQRPGPWTVPELEAALKGA